MKYIFTVLLISIALLNIYVTYKVIKSDSLETFQKIIFSVIVWLIPFIGALGIYLFLKDDDTPRGPRNPNDDINRIMGPMGMGGG